MAKKLDPLAEAKAAYKPRTYRQLIEGADEDIREYCEALKEGYKTNSLGGAPMSHFHRFAKNKFGDRFSISLTTFREWIRA